MPIPKKEDKKMDRMSEKKLILFKCRSQSFSRCFTLLFFVFYENRMSRSTPQRGSEMHTTTCAHSIQDPYKARGGSTHKVGRIKIQDGPTAATHNTHIMPHVEIKSIERSADATAATESAAPHKPLIPNKL